MGLFSKITNFFKPPKEPKVEAPVIKRQKPKAITPPKANVFVQVSAKIKSALKKQQLKSEYIPKDVPSTPEPVQDEKTAEEKADVYVHRTIESIERKVRSAKSKYTRKDGDTQKQKYQNDIGIHDMLDAQLLELKNCIYDAVREGGYVLARAKLERIDWESFDSTLYYYPTCLHALPYAIAVVEQSLTPIDATSVFDSAGQTDFEDEEFHY